MNTSEKLFLRWNGFQDNVNSAFGLLRNDTDLSDVTLASDDGTQIQSHKVILASSSPFFMEILRKNKHPHPLIFMRGTKTEDLVSLVDFIYNGEVYVDQENLDPFLALAGDLGLKGLTTRSLESSNEKADPPTHEIPPERIESVLPNPPQKNQPMAEEEDTLDTSCISSPHVVANVELDQLDEQVKSMMEVGENIIRLRIGKDSEKGWLCKVCGKEGRKWKIRNHIEAKHIRTGTLLPCDLCGNSSRFKKFKL